MASNKTEISSFKHQDKRVNIPPQELSAFVRDEELSPKAMLYPRDPSLDPQLVWKGKDEQDQEHHDRHPEPAQRKPPRAPGDRAPARQVLRGFRGRLLTAASGLGGGVGHGAP